MGRRDVERFLMGGKDPGLNAYHPEKKIQYKDRMPEEHSAEYRLALSDLIKAAKVSEKKMAHSYRNFNVGCALFAYDEENNEYEVYNAGNWKYEPGTQEGNDQRCAERNTLDGATKDQCSVVVGMVIVCEQTQKDSTSGVNSTVLTPCSKCRKMLRESPLIKPDTIITMINPKPDRSVEDGGAGEEGYEEWIEEMTVAELLARHGEEYPTTKV